LLELVQEVGNAAGLVALVALVPLSALLFSQARDIKRLREWAGRAPERSARPAASRAVPRQTASIPPRRSQPWHNRIRFRYPGVALVVLLVLGGAAAYGVTQLIGDGGGDNPGNAEVNKDDRAAVDPGNVTVAVLNGTTVPGLAGALGDRVAAAGFKRGTIDIFSDQQLPQSVVQYAPGHEAEAEAVSRRVGIRQRGPVSDEGRALAGDATVIVIIGADKAS
jgi:hypothetical protein